MAEQETEMRFNLQWIQTGLLILTLLFGIGQWAGRDQVGTQEQQRRIQQQERQLEKFADNLTIMQTTIASQNTSIVLLQAQQNEMKARIEAIASAVGARPAP